MKELTLQYVIFQNGQAYSRNSAANAARFVESA